MAGATRWLLLLLLLLFFCSCAQSLLRRQTRGASSSKVTLSFDGWFQQKLDHFSKKASPFWKQRYYVNDAFYKPGGPVFLFTEGSMRASEDLITSNYTWITYAQRLGALCFLLEHRFYGKSQPTGNVSTASLRYLSSKQALADIVYFRIEMAKEMGLTRNKWVTFGCSYGGSLAVWSRIKHPNLFDAAVGNSAPVFAKINFFEYLEVVQRSLDTYNRECSKPVKIASRLIMYMLKHSNYYDKLSQDFMLCHPLILHSVTNTVFVLERMMNLIIRIVQNHKNETVEVQPDNININDFCDIMTNTSMGSPYERYVRAVRTLLQKENQHCLQSDYYSYISARSNPILDTQNERVRQWLYQTCTEFGFFPTTESMKQPFSGVPLSYYFQKCRDVFGCDFNYFSLAKSVKATNKYYGGFNLKGSKVIFSNGSLDPWHVLGITKNKSKNLLAVIIKGEAHCSDVYELQDTDSAELIQARENIFQILKKWL